MAVANIATPTREGVPGEVTMKLMVYNWLDDMGVRKVGVDFQQINP